MIICNTRNLQNPVTGVQRYTHEILSRLPLEIKTISPKRPLRGVGGHVWEQCRLPFLLEGHVLWSPSNTGPLAVKNQIVTIHDLSPLDHPEWTTSKFSNWYRFLIPRLINNVTSVLTVSEFTKRRILHYCPDAAQKIHVTALGTSQEFFQRQAEEIEKAIAKLTLPSKRYLLAVGSLEPRKNLSRLIDVWREVHEQIASDLWLVFVGGVGQENIFAQLPLRDLPPRIYFAGRVEDHYLPALYSGAEAALYISLYEGFGLPVLEAMSCGTPIIYGNLTSLPEVAANAGIGVDPRNNSEIGEAIKLISGNSILKQTLIAKGLKRSQSFSWERAAHKVAEVLDKASGQ